MLAILTTHPIQYQVPLWQALARDGRLDRRGRPTPLQMAALLQEFRHELQMPWLADPLQRALLGALAAIAVRRGYRGAYGS